MYVRRFLSILYFSDRKQPIWSVFIRISAVLGFTDRKNFLNADIYTIDIYFAFPGDSF